MAYTTKVSDLGTFIKKKLDDEDYPDDLLLHIAQEAQDEIIHSKEWNFKKRTFSGQLATDKVLYNWPVGAEKLFRRARITKPDDAAGKLNIMSWEDFIDEFPNPLAGEPGKPEFWGIGPNKTFFVGPTRPDQAYIMDIDYLLEPTVLTGQDSVIDVPDSWREVQELGMLYRAYAATDNPDQADDTEVTFRDALDVMKGRVANPVSGPSQMRMPNMRRSHRRRTWR